uniref:VHA-E2 n=1 Tax=Arundo donax TaxID=35708 RepID=A0A0A9EUT5_ARUDO
MMTLGRLTLAFSAYSFLAASSTASTMFRSASRHRSTSAGSLSRSKLWKRYDTTVVSGAELATAAEVIRMKDQLERADLHDEAFEDLLVAVGVLGDAEESLAGALLHPGDEVVLRLQHLDAPATQPPDARGHPPSCPRAPRPQAQ